MSVDAAGGLVVQYRPGPELANPAVEWGGVFKASEMADKAFGEAEPPTHDDWRSNLVADSWHRRYVNVALREIKERVGSIFGTPVVTGGGAGQPSAVTIADGARLFLLATAPGTGASRRPRENRDSRGPDACRSCGYRPAALVRGGRRPTAIEARVRGRASVGFCRHRGRGRRIRCHRRRGRGVRTTSPAPVPLVDGFEIGHRLVRGSTLRVSADDTAPITVRVTQPTGVANVMLVDLAGWRRRRSDDADRRPSTPPDGCSRTG